MSGLFAIIGNDKQAQIRTYHALYALQHRGQYGCGIASNHNGYIDYEKGHGLVTTVFDDEILRLLRGQSAIGHVNNSQIDIPVREIDPKIIGYRENAMACCFDGFLLNYEDLKEEIDRRHVDYENISHTEVVANLIALHFGGSIEESIFEVLKKVKGAYALAIITENKMIGVRDPYGLKPLIIGKLNDSYILTSETCAIDAVGAKVVREVEPGEMVIVEGGVITSEKIFEPICKKTCIFEVIYFARPDSIINGRSVYSMRVNSGKMLALADPDLKADVVIGAPDSGTMAAIGYAEASDIHYGVGIIKNRYIGRTFIEKTQEERANKVRIKLNVLKEDIEDKDVVIVDDSIIRGTTMKRTVKMLRDAGARTIHVRVASPLVPNSCIIGVNASVNDRMIAKTHTVEEIRQIIGADTLKFIEVDQLLTALGDKERFCTGCINKKYPIEVENETGL